jgi:multidrug efflux system outer membrane protein
MKRETAAKSERRLADTASRLPARARGGFAAGAVATLLLAGCAQGPDYTRPDLADITAQTYTAERPVAADSTALTDSTGLVQPNWWAAFGDTTLNRLVTEALLYNNDLEQAVGRVLEARALHGGSEAARWPTIGIGASAARNKLSMSLPSGQVSFYNNQFSAQATFNWELDLWGRLSRAEQAAYAELLASEQNRRIVAQTLVADVVRTWLEIRELEAQLALTQRTIVNFEDNLTVVRDRYLRGLVSSLDLRLARQNLASALAKRPFDEQNLNAARRRMEVLLGRYPAGTIASSAPGYDPAVLPDPLPAVPAGLPSSLLERRPDLIAAEMSLAAATARIGQAKAALFPRIALTAEGGTRSNDIEELFKQTTSIWSLVANLTMPLINRGELTAQVKASQARTAQAVAAYRSTILRAFREVEGALDAEHYLREQEIELRRSAEEARRSLLLAEERYRRGLDNLLFILDSQRRLFNAENTLLTTQRAARTARVNLILALGGPWDLAAVPSPLTDDKTMELSMAADPDVDTAHAEETDHE